MTLQQFLSAPVLENDFLITTVGAVTKAPQILQRHLADAPPSRLSLWFGEIKPGLRRYLGVHGCRRGAAGAQGRGRGAAHPLGQRRAGAARGPASPCQGRGSGLRGPPVGRGTTKT